MSLARRIKIAREAAGLSQSQLGERVGVTKGAVSNWENGRDSPTTQNLKKIGGACSVDLAWLHDDQGNQPLTRHQRKALEILAALDDESRANWFSVGNLLPKRAAPKDTAEDWEATC